MNLIIEGFSYENNEFFKLAINIRNSVYVDQLGFDKHWEFDGNDFKAMHYIVFLNDTAVGCARWTEKDQKITIDRFCILPKYRKSGFAFVLIKFIIADVIPSKKNVFVYSTADCLGFFQQFGFVLTDDVLKLNPLELKILQLQ